MHGPVTPRTEPKTVGAIASQMLKILGYHYKWQQQADQKLAFHQWRASYLDNPDWIRWYEFLYARASQGINPPQPESAARIAALRKKMEALPVPVRAWTWFGLADDAMMIPLPDTPLASEAEMIEAGRQLGSAALLGFLRDGTRAGLRGAASEDPARGRRFILSHARQLFGPQDAQALLEMGHFTAAADANPAMASQSIRQAVKVWRSEKQLPGQRWDRARAVAALLDLRGDSETEFIVHWFYEEPYDSSASSAQSVFVTEVERRRPKEWKNTFRALVNHPGFDQLTPLDVVHVARLLNKLSGEEIVPEGLLIKEKDVEARNKLRAWFGIAPIEKKQLVASGPLREQPLWSAKLKQEASSLDVDSAGKVVAIGLRRDGGVLMLDADTGRSLAELPVKGDYVFVHFRRPDDVLLTFGAANEIREFSADGRPLTTRPLAIRGRRTTGESAISDAGDLLAHRGDNLQVIDLTGAKPPWIENVFMPRIRAFGVLAMSPDGKRVVICDEFTKPLLLWDTGDKKLVAKLDEHAGIPSHACFSRDGKMLISTADDSKVLLWDGRTGALRREFWSDAARRGVVAFTSDSTHFIAPSGHGEFAVFDCETGNAALRFKTQGAYITQITAAPDGARLFVLVRTMDGDSRLDCWELKHP